MPKVSKEYFESKRKIILDAALKVFSKKPSYTVSMKDIRDGAEAVYDMGIVSIMPALKRAMPLEEAIANSRSLIVDATERACRFMSIDL